VEIIECNEIRNTILIKIEIMNNNQSNKHVEVPNVPVHMMSVIQLRIIKEGKKPFEVTHRNVYFRQKSDQRE
jgi:hypothetical protein